MTTEPGRIKALWLLVMQAEVDAGALDTATLTTRQVKDVLTAPDPSASACPNACYLAGRCQCRPSANAASPLCSCGKQAVEDGGTDGVCECCTGCERDAPLTHEELQLLAAYGSCRRCGAPRNSRTWWEGDVCHHGIVCTRCESTP